MYIYLLITLSVCVHQSLQVQPGANPPGVPPKETVYADGYEPGGHGGHGGHGLNVKPHDKEHIKEHLKEVIDKPKEEMTEEELEFHYFKLHDYDNNNKLDGTEITKAITHFHAEDIIIEEEDEDDEDPAVQKQQQENAKVFSDTEIADIVDMVIKEDDLNHDGYIEYPEFVAAQRKARS